MRTMPGFCSTELHILLGYFSAENMARMKTCLEGKQVPAFHGSRKALTRPYKVSEFVPVSVGGRPTILPQAGL
ncbi:Uncharacterized protein APZ42_029006 [Daphnia magna]|uniref:Uncharacterized protein n=1 Tax=Daphnia magna TaxID=35525 RepID=A0A164PZS5_9CRUS|nr:Uncharacterized protein APZ42_029006 [Daphnia magna]